MSVFAARDALAARKEQLENAIDDVTAKPKVSSFAKSTITKKVPGSYFDQLRENAIRDAKVKDAQRKAAAFGNERERLMRELEAMRAKRSLK